MKNENRNRELHALDGGCGQFSRRIGSTTYAALPLPEGRTYIPHNRGIVRSCRRRFAPAGTKGNGG